MRMSKRTRRSSSTERRPLLIQKTAAKASKLLQRSFLLRLALLTAYRIDRRPGETLDMTFVRAYCDHTNKLGCRILQGFYFAKPLPPTFSTTPKVGSAND